MHPVTPFMGVWIEMATWTTSAMPASLSHPLWVCGLKYLVGKRILYWKNVTPFMGVWIEMYLWKTMNRCSSVTPFMGVWIEISGTAKESAIPVVTPFMGVWIEIEYARHGV